MLRICFGNNLFISHVLQCREEIRMHVCMQVEIYFLKCCEFSANFFFVNYITHAYTKYNFFF